MKKVIVGLSFMLSATILNAAVMIAGAIMGTVQNGWSSDMGRLWTAIAENNLFFWLLIAQIFLVVGIVILIKEYFDKSTR